MTFRFVHAADIHLDSPLRSLAFRDAALAELVGIATRRAFVATVDLCLLEQVDALLLSGDLYDGDQTSMKTARFLAEQLRRLHEAGIRAYIIRGNHDALSKITQELTFAENTVTLFGSRASFHVSEREPGTMPVAIHGVSFAKPHAPDSLLPSYRAPVEGAFNIGLMHTSLGGSPGHDPYAPVALADLQDSGFRYWALGHVHARATMTGSATIVMPGMPQGRDIGEAGPKFVILVTVGDDGSVQIEEKRTSVAQFERVAISLDGAQDWRDMVAALAAALGAARDAVESEHLVARLRLTGATPLNWRLRREVDLLRSEAEEQGAALGRTWIDKVEVDTRAPSGGTSEGLPAGSADPVVELERLMSEVAGDDAYRREVQAIGEELRAQLPPDGRELLGADAASFATMLEEATRDGVADVLARLRGGGG